MGNQQTSDCWSAYIRDLTLSAESQSVEFDLDPAILMYICLAVILIGFLIMVIAVALSVRYKLQVKRPGERTIEEMADGRIPPPREGKRDDTVDEPHYRSRRRR